MGNFTVANSTSIGGGSVQQAVATTYKTLVLLANSSATTATQGAGLYKRYKLYDVLVGTNGTPADNYMEFDVTRATVGTTPAGITATLVTSLSSNFGVDEADDTGTMIAIEINSTAEVGIAATTQKLYMGVNQRASYRWVANPGSEIVGAATSSATGGNGMAVRARSGAYTGTATATVFFSD